MDVLHACCAGLDVHKKTVVACVRRVDPAGKVSKSIKTFATMTANLLDLSDWLAAQGVKVVAMESTGSYWKPVFNLLEPRFEVVLVNAHHIKQVPGRKTDVRDSEWIAQLLQHGLLRPSFIPPRPIRELRDLTRQRTQLINERTAVINRIQKVLEDANVKLGSVASNALGVSGRLMIEAIIRGEYDLVKLADLARSRLRKKIPDGDSADLYPGRGQPALPPWRLALVTVMQLAEDLSDRQATDAVRRRIDWKSALGLELDHPGSDFSVLGEFRGRLTAGGAERLRLEQLLEACQARHLLEARGRQRTDSTHVLAAARALNRLELVGETLRAAWNAAFP